MADLTQMSIAPAAPAEPQAAQEHDRAKVKELAYQFESMLMTQMLRSMRQSMLSDEESDGFGKSMMTDAFAIPWPDPASVTRPRTVPVIACAFITWGAAASASPNTPRRTKLSIIQRSP